MKRGTLEVWLLVAGAAHVAVLLLASRLPLPPAVVAAPPVEIALEEEPAPEAASAVEQPPVISAALVASGAEPARVASGAVVTAAAVVDGAAASGVVAAERGGWSFSATTAARAPDLLASRALLVPSGADVPTPEPPPASTQSKTGGLAEALDARDSARGLGRGGPVLSAVEEAARVPGESAPEGHATFEVTVHRSGSVSVLVRDASDGTWESLRDAVERGVSAKRVRLPPNAEGMRFVIKIDARVQWPDGRRPKDIKTEMLYPTGKVELPTERHGFTFDIIPRIGVAHEGKVCSGSIALYPGQIGITGSCSPENIGQPPARVVHGRIESEVRL